MSQSTAVPKSATSMGHSSLTSHQHSLPDWSIDEHPLFSNWSSIRQPVFSTTVNEEVNQEMSYKESVRSVCSFMGWTHIPVIYLTCDKEWEKANNPWKGKNPRPPIKVSVALPPNEWLCQKLEKLNLEVVEFYISRSQDFCAFKVDQFVRTLSPS